MWTVHARERAKRIVHAAQQRLHGWLVQPSQNPRVHNAADNVGEFEPLAWNVPTRVLHQDLLCMKPQVLLAVANQFMHDSPRLVAALEAYCRSGLCARGAAPRAPAGPGPKFSRGVTRIEQVRKAWLANETVSGQCGFWVAASQRAVGEVVRRCGVCAAFHVAAPAVRSASSTSPARQFSTTWTR